VTALALREDGLYIGTYGGGVTRRVAGAGPKGQFEAFPETEGLKVNAGCLVEAGGRLYLGTDGQGLFRLSRDGARFEPLRLPLPSSRVTAILSGPGALYVGTDEGLARLPLPLQGEGSWRCCWPAESCAARPACWSPPARAAPTPPCFRCGK
jgi:hypothetical protein